MNNISIMGRLGQDVDLRYRTDETAVARFSVAVGRGKDREGNDLGTDWFTCTSFGKQAEAIHRFFHKGDCIGITGKVRIESYEDKEGIKRKSFAINVREFSFGNNGGGSAAQKRPTEDHGPVPGFSTPDEDIPF